MRPDVSEVADLGAGSKFVHTIRIHAQVLEGSLKESPAPSWPSWELRLKEKTVQHSWGNHLARPPHAPRP